VASFYSGVDNLVWSDIEKLSFSGQEFDFATLFGAAASPVAGDFFV